MTFALNLADLLCVPPALCTMLIVPMLDAPATTNAEPARIDGMAAVVKPQIAADRLAAALILLADLGVVGLRVYRQRGTTWHQLTVAELAALLPAQPIAPALA